jgi:hypothetical protein
LHDLFVDIPIHLRIHLKIRIGLGQEQLR